MLTIYLPHLDWSHLEEVPPLDTPALNQILRFGRKRPQSVADAAFCFSALGVDLPESCAYAAPIVHQAGMHSVHISGAHHLMPTEAESQQLCQWLNELYADDGWRFSVHSPYWWLLDMPQKPDWQTPCVLDVLGMADGMARPVGRDGRDWVQKFTEIQMALHAHPLNEARREAGKMPMNGLWLWHDLPAKVPDLIPENTKAVLSDSPYAASGSLILQEDWAACVQLVQDNGINPDDVSLYFNALSLAAEMADVQAYGWHLQQIDERFLAPALQAMGKGQICGLTLHTQSGCVQWHKKNSWQFWRRTPRFGGCLF